VNAAPSGPGTPPTGHGIEHRLRRPVVYPIELLAHKLNNLREFPPNTPRLGENMELRFEQFIRERQYLTNVTPATIEVSAKKSGVRQRPLLRYWRKSIRSADVRDSMR